MFKAGDVVKNKLNDKVATVLEVLESGMVRIRFDGETQSMVLHSSRFEKHTVDKVSTPAGPPAETFKCGDYIEAELDNEDVVRGAAITDLGIGGYATYSMLTDDGRYLELNSNYNKFRVIFRASIARGQMPKY